MGTCWIEGTAWRCWDNEQGSTGGGGAATRWMEVLDRRSGWRVGEWSHGLGRETEKCRSVGWRCWTHSVEIQEMRVGGAGWERSDGDRGGDTRWGHCRGDTTRELMDGDAG